MCEVESNLSPCHSHAVSSVGGWPERQYLDVLSLILLHKVHYQRFQSGLEFETSGKFDVSPWSKIPVIIHKMGYMKLSIVAISPILHGFSKNSIRSGYPFLQVDKLLLHKALHST